MEKYQFQLHMYLDESLTSMFAYTMYYAQQYLLRICNFDVLKNVNRIQVASLLWKVNSCYRSLVCNNITL